MKIPTNQRFLNTKLFVHNKMFSVYVASFVNITFDVKFKALLSPQKPRYLYPYGQFS